MRMWQLWKLAWHAITGVWVLNAVQADVAFEYSWSWTPSEAHGSLRSLMQRAHAFTAPPGQSWRILALSGLSRLLVPFCRSRQLHGAKRRPTRRRGNRRNQQLAVRGLAIQSGFPACVVGQVPPAARGLTGAVPMTSSSGAI
jgi:hypothetical protein